jgi:phage terminase large subunit GpA-like protein
MSNKDVLVVLPTLELRDRSFNPRLSKMLEETEALRGMVTNAARNKANRADLLEYGAGARILKAGANSPDSLRSDHLPYVICDEVDAYPWDVGGEGDPMTLIDNRQRTFSRAKTLLVSTPTKEDASRITQEYERSDMRRYHVPCPHCGERQPLEFGGKEAGYGLKWKRARNWEKPGDRLNVVERAWYVCRACAAEIEEGQKTEMLQQGRWIAARPHVKDVRGYHINALYAPVGLGLSWKRIAEKWLEAQKDTSKLKSFANTYLGEVWREAGDSIDGISLLSRLEDYRPAEAVPGRIVTAGVDVQKDRLEITLTAWGEDEECWLLDHVILPGDTAQGEVWRDLADLLPERRVVCACVDSGYNAGFVYAFCEPRRWAIPTKGLSGMGRPLVEDDRRRKQRLRTRRKRSVALEPLGVDQGKALLYARLKITLPGPGYVHFPREPAFDDEYFAQLAAEKLVTKIRGTRPFAEWVQTRPRNEALDCLILALAALRMARLPGVAARYPGETGMATPPAPQLAQSAPPAPAPSAQKPPPRHGSNEWSSRL